MSGISKTIERVNKLWDAKPFDWEKFSDAAGDSIMPIIAELEDYRERFSNTMQLLRNEKAELETANKRIAYLEKCNDYYEGNRCTHPSKE